MQQTIKLLTEALSPYADSREIKAQIRLLLEEVCDLTYTQIVMADYRSVTPQQVEQLRQCAARLAKGEPVQQVLGYAWFRGRRFSVNPDVLIPRPETAELVDIIVDSFVNKPVDKCGDNPVYNPTVTTLDNLVDKPLYNLLDIGTGSGCIALSLAADIHHSFITAVDISQQALITAQSNASSLNINNIRFVKADILQEADADFSTELNTLSTSVDNPVDNFSPALYDAIVSNPPYICQRERIDMSTQVLNHEPHLALFVPDDDPLLFYRAIGRYALRHLRLGGSLYFEINAAYGSDTCALLTQLGFSQVSLRKDMQGLDRMVIASL